MQIILLHPRFTQAKSVTLTPRHLAWLLLAMLALVMAAALLHVLAARLAADIQSPFPARPARTCGAGDQQQRPVSEAKSCGDGEQAG